MSTLFQDVRFALRMLRKSPGFTAVAVGTLALAIGANAVVFSIMNALILRPLNVPRPESLYVIERASDLNPPESYANYLDLRDRNRSFESLAAFAFAQAGFDSGGDPTRVWYYEVSGNYFDALGIRAYLGRFLHSSDERGPGSAPYIVLTHEFWHSHFQDDRGVVGRTVQINKQPYTIIGVAPAGFRGTFLPFHPAFFAPIINHDVADLNARGNRWVDQAIGHLKAGVSPAQAVADLNSIGTDLKRTYPKDEDQLIFLLARPNLFGDYAGRAIRAFVVGLMLLAGLILLAACANLGGLFAARAADRAREVALRLALGAGRLRILRQLFTEALLLSVIGGAVGLWGSVLILGGLSARNPLPRFPFGVPVNPDAHVYEVALLLTFVSGFLFGAVPVRQVLRTEPYGIIKSGSAGVIGQRLTARDLLLGAQIAICALLVTSSFVAVRGLARSLHSKFGFDPQHAMLVDTDLQMAGYTGDQVPQMQKRMIDALAAIPGVESVGLSDLLLLDTSGTSDSNVFTDNTTDLRPANAAADAYLYHISPEYLHAEGTVLLLGRTFTWHDDKNSPRVAVVNREFARRLFGSATKALGKSFKLPDGKRIQVVGITEEGKYDSLAEAPQPAMFLPILQWPASGSQIVVRSSRDPRQLGPALRSALRNLDAGLPVHIDTRYNELDAALFAPRMATISLGVLGMMGAMLSITGIFGLAAYSVSKRLRELGIRMALGAQRNEVLQAALGRAVKLLAVGSAAGLLLGILASRVLAFIVYEATSRDPLVLAGVVLAMALLGLVATWIPARRALSIEPAILMREE
ncbi:MAG TPA: ABC transporter permease [Terriglobia bacterium]|nr:ABC transporter permease [Terriglobia bacterium]